jgi:hypothetical protein
LRRYFVVISSLRTSTFDSTDTTVDLHAEDLIPSVQWYVLVKAIFFCFFLWVLCLSCPAFAGHVLESCLFHGGTWRPTQLRQVVIAVQIATKAILCTTISSVAVCGHGKPPFRLIGRVAAVPSDEPGRKIVVVTRFMNSCLAYQC